MNPRHESTSSRFLENVDRYENGQMDQLICPHCSDHGVSIYFDGPRLIGEHLWTRVYFLCLVCRQWDRTTYPGLPPHFDETRDILHVKEW